MTGCEFGDVLLVPFPFTDQSTTRRRPAVVVSSGAYHRDRADLIILAVTSQTRPAAGVGETASASNAQRTDSVAVTGMRLVDGVCYAQIVGATTNKENAYPEPGAAVYTVLSGTFDQVP